MCQEAQWAVHFVTQHPLGLLLFPHCLCVPLGYFQIGLPLCAPLGYFQTPLLSWKEIKTFCMVLCQSRLKLVCVHMSFVDVYCIAMPLYFLQRLTFCMTKWKVESKLQTQFWTFCTFLSKELEMLLCVTDTRGACMDRRISVIFHLYFLLSPFHSLTILYILHLST